MLQVDAAHTSESDSVRTLEDAKLDVEECKKALQEALERVEAANHGKLAVEDIVRRWRSESGHKRRSIGGSPKFKRAGHRRKHSRSMDMVSDVSSSSSFKPTLSIGQILTMKLTGPDGYDKSVWDDKTGELPAISLGQIINRKSAVMCTEETTAPERISGKRKKFALTGLSGLLAKQSKSKKKRESLRPRRPSTLPCRRCLPCPLPPAPSSPRPPESPVSPRKPPGISRRRGVASSTHQLVSDPDLDRVPSPPSSTPPRSPASASSDGEEVPDSAPCSAKAAPPSIDTSTGPGGPHALNPSSSLAAINGPTLHSIFVTPPTYPSTTALHGTSPPRAAPLLLDETGWVTVPDRRRPRRDEHSSAPSPTTRSSQAVAAAAALRFKRRTEGLCARCLAPAHHHLSSSCRDKIRCLSCNLSGHKERHCPLRQALRAAKNPRPRLPPRHPSSSPSAPGARSWAAVAAAPAAAPAPSPRLLLPPPPPMATSGIGAAVTRPEEDTVVISTSFELNKDMKDWEETAAIAWVINGNRKVQALAIDRAVRKKFRLSHNDIDVCPHQPVQFLLKFVRKAHCSEVLQHGRIKADGALLQFRPWRPLEHAFGASMSYRVRLCLEGVPAYGYTSYVAERIIAQCCSFDRLADSSALLTSARSLDCWAWTANPSSIPKVVWLTFTSRGNGGPASEVFVHEVRPTGSKRGATFRVLVHLDQMEDYSLAPLDFFGSSNDASAFKPTPVPFDWHYLTVDGMPPVPLQNVNDEETLRAAALARRDRRGKDDDHPRYYPSRRGDRDDDQDRDGAARQDAHSHGSRHAADGSVRRERTRSPRRRDDYDAGHGRRHDVVMEDPPVDLSTPCTMSTPAALSPVELRAMLAEQASLLRVELRAYIDEVTRPVLAESEALRRWNARAMAILEKLEASSPSLATPVSSTPSSPAHHASPSRSMTAMPAADLLGPLDGPATVGRTDHAASLDGTVAQLELLQIEVGNEAWNEPNEAPDDDARARSPIAPQVRPHALATLAMSSYNGNVSTDLVGFIGAIAVPVQPPLVATPSPKRKRKRKTAAPLPSPRRSGRLAIKKKSRLVSDGTVAVQELIARVCGILAPAASFDDASWAAYQHMFQSAPLASSAIQALEALVKHVKKLKKKGPARAVVPAVPSGSDD
ncbi:hypothetical protein ACQ4PT_035394 [Festuca glaucescens]